ncbi:MAG: ATP-binding protein [Deltaproteobacteria bacterium]|nr:ATP-binding protein [Deltaproteobacteria bacterium]
MRKAGIGDEPISIQGLGQLGDVVESGKGPGEVGAGDRYLGSGAAGATAAALRLRPEAVMGYFARSIELSTTRIDDLVAPPQALSQLERLEQQIRQRSKILNTWSFATRGGEAAGVTAVLHGPEGHGKTLTARVLAKRLDQPLYSVDLARVEGVVPVETLNNLDALFAAAARLDAVLLFENADTLFRPRGSAEHPVSDATYLISSYLNQKLKTHGGVVILESDRNIDSAALSAASLKIELPFPDAPQRAGIWQRAFPAGTPLGDGITPERLAPLNLSGGQICQVARNAASIAAAQERAVTLTDLRTAVYDEYAKNGRITSGVERQVFGS